MSLAPVSASPGSASTIAEVSTEAFGAEQVAMLDRFTMRIFRSPELSETMAAVLDAVVPAFAQSAHLVLEGDDESDALPSAETVAVPLTADGEPVGVLYLENPDRRNAALLRAVAARCARAVSNALRFERERQTARTLQSTAMVLNPPNIAGYRFDTAYETSSTENVVGGSWFDAFPVTDGRFILSVGSVAGTGLDAAMATINVRQTLRGVAQVHPDPALMLQAAERTLRSQHPGRTVTAFVAVIDPVTQRCSWANAGHPHPYVRLPDGVVLAIRGAAEALGTGLASSSALGVRDFALPPGAVLIARAEAPAEASRSDADHERCLEDLLRDPALLHRDRVARDVADALRGTAVGRDIAVIVLRAESSVPVRRWRFDPQWSDVAQRVKQELRDALEAILMDPGTALDAELVFSELIGNAVRHAPGIAELILEAHHDRVVLHLLDKGPGFAFCPRLPSNLYSEAGRGLFLVSAFSTEFTVERHPGGGSHARVTFTLRKGEQTR